MESADLLSLPTFCRFRIEGRAFKGMSSQIPVTESLQSIILERHLHHIPTRVGKPQRIVEAIGIAVVGLYGVFVLYGDVGREHTADDGIVQTAVHVDKVEVVIMLVQGIATVEGVGNVAVSETVGVAASAPGVIAQPLHGVAVDGGRQAALVVFQGVVHGASLVDWPE